MKLNAADKRVFKAMTSFPWDEDGGPSFYEVVEQPNPHDVFKYGIARRAINDDPGELVRFALLGVRERWRSYLRFPQSEEASLWHTGLWALAINDRSGVERILAEAPKPSGDASPFPPYYREFSELFFGIALSDELRSRPAADALMRRKLPSNEAATAACLTAILDQQSDAFAESLDAVCKTKRKIRAIDPQYKFIDALAHGLWSLGHRRAPAVVECWDVSHSLPWDAGLHEWCLAHEEAREAIDDTRLSEHGRAALDMPASERGM